MPEKFKKYLIELTTREPDYESNKNSNLYLLIGFLFFIFCIYVLEIRQPFYFTQDDSYTLGLPLYLEYFRNLFEHGIITTLNPYQFTGSPVSDILTGILYPVTYICYLFARFVVGNDLYFMDVYAIANLAMCYFIFYIACRCLKVRPSIAVLCSLFYTLSGYNLIVTRSWSCFAPVMALCPLIVPVLNYLKDKTSFWRWFALTGIFLAMLFVGGNIQMDLYLLIFMLIAVIQMVFFKQITIKRALYLIPAVILGIAIAFPNLFVTYDLLGRVNRTGVSYGDWNSLFLPALFLPYPFYLIFPEKDWISYYQVLFFGGGLNTLLIPIIFPTIKNWTTFTRGELFFAGGLNSILTLILFPILNILSLKIKKNIIWEIFKNNLYIILAIIAFSLCFGEQSIIWKLLHALPIFNQFRGSFKFILFFNLFSILGLSIFLERIYSIFKIKRIYKKCFMFFMYFSVLYSMFVSIYAFSLFKINFFPNKESYYPEILKSQDSFRIYPIVNIENQDPNFFYSLTRNFPTYKKVLSIIGYRDYLESELPENYILFDKSYFNNFARAEYISENSSKVTKINPDIFRAFKAYGVKYILVDPFFEKNIEIKTRSGDIKFGIFLNSVLKKVYSKNRVDYYEVPSPDPMAFIFDHPEKPLPIKFNGQGAVVNISSLNKPEKIVINMLLRPNMNTFDDKNIRINTHHDKWGRIIANINGKSKAITVQYMPKWGLGFILGILMLFVSILTMRRINYLNHENK